MGNEDMGRELRENNEKIVECILLLKEQRDELTFIIDKQQEERKKLETEMERITYKLCLINKSLAQRIKAKSSYDNTINEIEENYAKLVRESDDLLGLIKTEFDKLESLINKKTSTEDAPSFDPTHQNGSGEQILRTIEIQPSGSRTKICQCAHKPMKQIRKNLIDKANQSVQADQEVPTKLQDSASVKNDSNEIKTQLPNDNLSEPEQTNMPKEQSNTD
ncbi:uncharacterized protein [Leptinotarsa decemlineata]|uniref:uncharacterized protein n=1 Tax=Leptinotarsa decemlineata TaxID=7539 RepID=UPI000C252A9D|nr:uncharacterized protein LOC111509069 [Leptinotarsa decemlineata]